MSKSVPEIEESSRSITIYEATTAKALVVEHAMPPRRLPSMPI